MLPARDGVREVQAQLDEYLARLGQRVRLESAVVVGSRARGEHLRKSDVDLVVLSPDFAGMRRGERTELLLMDWDFLPPLEPQGATAEEALAASSLYWWDALADGRPILDRGGWTRARAAFSLRRERGELQRTARGWRSGPEHLPAQ